VLVGGQDRLEVPVGIHVEFVDQAVRRRHDAVHRLQTDISCGTAVAEQPVCLAAAHGGAQVDAVWTLHAPGQNVVHAGPPDREDRIRVDPKSLVDTDPE